MTVAPLVVRSFDILETIVIGCACFLGIVIWWGVLALLGAACLGCVLSMYCLLLCFLVALISIALLNDVTISS